MIPLLVGAVWHVLFANIGILTAPLRDCAFPTVVGVAAYSIGSGSALPNLPVDSVIVTTCLLPQRPLYRGDLILFRHAHTFYVKRLVGLPGDRVSLRGGMPVVNGVVWRQNHGVDAETVIERNGAGFSYLIERPDPSGRFESMAETLVAADRLFVLGDNRDDSLDSRFPDVGQVRLQDVVSRAVLLLQWRADHAGPTLTWIARPG